MALVRIDSPLAGSIVSLAVEAGATVARGALVAVVESMKMEHEVRSPGDGVIEALRHRVGDVVEAGSVLATLRPAHSSAPAALPSSPATPCACTTRAGRRWCTSSTTSFPTAATSTAPSSGAASGR